MSARPGLGLRSGDVVTLQVLKRLTDEKWAVGLKGRVLPARTALELSPGATLRARVQSAGGQIIFVVEPAASSPLAESLSRQGIPATPDAQLIAAALIRSGRPVDAEVIARIRGLLDRARLEARRGARAAATMLDKGIDPASPGAADLLELLCLEESGGRNPRRRQGRPFPRNGREAKASLARTAEPGSAASSLQVYNALRGRSETWIVVPFSYREGGKECPGTLRLLVDPFANRLRRLVLGVMIEGSGTWHFAFDLEGRRRMSVYCDDAAAVRAERANLDTLVAKVHNMGIEVSDTVGEGREFDGFSAREPGDIFTGVDAEG